jgi:hypothetical protein
MNAQDSIRKNILKISEKIEKGIIENSYVYEPPRPSSQYQNFIDLKNKATIKELYSLCEFPSSTVRCYAFWALAYKDKSNGLINKLIAHLNDTAEVQILFGDIGWSQTVGDFYYNVLRPDYVDTEVRKLTKDENVLIDSILLYNKKINNASKDLLLTNIEPKSKYYDRIKEIAIEEKNPIAVFALSKFKQPEDLIFVSNLLDNKNTQYWGFRSIMNFQDSIFKPKLEAFQKVEIPKKGGFDYPKLRVFYKAVASYQDNWAHDLMQNTLQNAEPVAKKYHSKYIWIACKKYPNQLFSDLVNQIKLSEFELSYIDSEIEIE